MATWLSDPKTVDALRRLADKLNERIVSAPKRAHGISYRSPHQAHQRLQETRTLRPLWLAATKLLLAHDQQQVPGLLGCVKTRSHLSALLALGEGGDGGALTDEVKRVLAGAGIRAEDAYSASEQLLALLPPPDAPEERQFRLWLEREDLRLDFYPEAGEAPQEALNRLLEVAQLESGQSVLNLSAGAGYVAERLAGQVPDASIILVEAQERLRPALQWLVSLYPSLVLSEETDLLRLTGQYDRVVLRLAERWHTQRRDFFILQQAFKNLLAEGGCLAALVDAGYSGDPEIARLQAWVAGAGGLVERLEGSGWRDALVLLALSKPVLPAGEVG